MACCFKSRKPAIPNNQEDIPCIQQLHTLIQECDNEGIITFIRKQDSGILESFKHGSSVVGMAVKSGSLDVVKTLVSAGFDPEEDVSPLGHCARPIHLACKAGHLDIVKFLVEDHGVNLQTRDSCLTEAPIFHAVFNGRLNVVYYFVESGYSTIEKVRRAKLLLKCDVESQQLAIHEYLLSVLHDNEQRIYRTEYLHEFHTLIRAGRIQAALNWMRPFNLTPKNYYKNCRGKIRAVGCAVKSGGLDVVKRLLSRGFKVDDNCNTRGGCLFPLYIAVQEGNLDMVKLLCTHDAHLDASCFPDDKDPLALAIRENCADIVRYMLIELNTPLIHTEGFASFKPLGNDPDKIDVERRNNTIHILISAGYDPMEEVVTTEGPQQTQVRRYVNLNPRAGEPRSLLDLCCINIRRRLGMRLCTTVDDLPLPESVKDKLKLKHILTFPFSETNAD